MRYTYGFLLAFILMACGPEPTKSIPSPAPQSSANTLPESPLPITTPELTPVISEAQIKAILTSKNLNLLVNEELMLIGDIQLTDGSKRSFDQIQNLISLKNNHPDLLSLDLKNRLVKALKSGVATVEIASLDNPQLKVLVSIQISPASSEIDPNVALVDVEIQ